MSTVVTPTYKSPIVLNGKGDAPSIYWQGWKRRSLQYAHSRAISWIVTLRPRRSPTYPKTIISGEMGGEQ